MLVTYAHKKTPNHRGLFFSASASWWLTELVGWKPFKTNITAKFGLINPFDKNCPYIHQRTLMPIDKETLVLSRSFRNRL